MTRPAERMWPAERAAHRAPVRRARTGPAARPRPRGRSTDPGATWGLGPARREPVKTGAMRALGAACRGERGLRDYVSLAFEPEGRVHDAFAVGKNLGNERRTALVHDAGTG